jgi:hypothetical protein
MNRIAKWFTVGAMGMVFTVSSFAAGVSARFNVPFEFEANGVTLEAGQYIVTQASAHAVQVTALGGKQIFLLDNGSGNIENEATNAKMVFRRYGNRYFLAATKPAGADKVREFSKTKREKELSSRAANSIDTVVVAAE